MCELEADGEAVSGKGFGRSTSPRWLELTDRRQEVTCLSQLYHWESHWDIEARRSRRCGGKLCYCCSIGAQRQLRVVLLVQTASGEERLLEVRERHRESFDRFESTVGLRLFVRKEGTAKNAPVSVRPGEFGYAIERDISRLVDCLGLSPVLLAEGAVAISPADAKTDGCSKAVD